MDKEMIDYSLIIPTYRRQNDLAKCLASIENLKYRFKEVVIVVRENDIETINYLNRILQDFIFVSQPGQIAAIKLGMKTVTGGIVVFIDDDTEVDNQWIDSAMVHFQHVNVGAVGGRDFQPSNQNAGSLATVGKFTRRGKLIGNHHLSNRTTHNVNFLKGCNMFIRRCLLDKISPIFDHLQGDGAQYGSDLVISITSNLCGFKTIYDSKVQLIHHASPRPGQPRESTDQKTRDEENFNVWLIKLAFARKNFFLIAILYGLLVGDNLTPGVIKSLQLHGIQFRMIHRDMISNFRAFTRAVPLGLKFRQPLAD
jgi:glycosyltransferase involved in cell wall biosynthesis